MPRCLSSSDWLTEGVCVRTVFQLPSMRSIAIIQDESNNNGRTTRINMNFLAVRRPLFGIFLYFLLAVVFLCASACSASDECAADGSCKDTGSSCDKDGFCEESEASAEKYNEKANREARLAEEYEKEPITSEADMLIRDELDAADELSQFHQQECFDAHAGILERVLSPRAIYTQGRILEYWANSENVTDEASKREKYYEVVESHYLRLMRLGIEGDVDIRQDLFRISSDRAVAILTHYEDYAKIAEVCEIWLRRFPGDRFWLKNLGTNLYSAGKLEEAEGAYRKILEEEEGNKYALLHLSWVIRGNPNKDKAAKKEGFRIIRSMDPIEIGQPDLNVRDFHLLAMIMLKQGRLSEMEMIYKDGVKLELFLSYYQRPMDFIEGLTAKPVWSTLETSFWRYHYLLETNWKEIRDEALAIFQSDKPKLKNLWQFDKEGLTKKGSWKELQLYNTARKMKYGCKAAPKTCKLVGSWLRASACHRCDVKFSVIYPGTQLWSHVGQTNTRLRAHLGLVVPPGVRMRIADLHNVTFAEGRTTIIDDSFEHELWHTGDSPRINLVVDFWHPEVTEEEMTPFPSRLGSRKLSARLRFEQMKQRLKNARIS